MGAGLPADHKQGFGPDRNARAGARAGRYHDRGIDKPGCHRGSPGSQRNAATRNISVEVSDTAFYIDGRLTIILFAGTRRRNSRSPAEFRQNAIGNGKGHTMISRRTVVFSLTVGTLLTAILPVSAKSRGTNLIRMLDTDNDGTVDLAEAKKAASGIIRPGWKATRTARWINANWPGGCPPRSWPPPIPTTTVRSQETSILLSSSSASAPPTPDHDGTLDSRELNSAAGRALLRLLK